MVSSCTGRTAICYRTLFEQSPDGVVVIDAFTRLPLEYNETAHRRLGYTRDEFATLRINDMKRPRRPITMRGIGDHEPGRVNTMAWRTQCLLTELE